MKRFFLIYLLALLSHVAPLSAQQTINCDASIDALQVHREGDMVAVRFTINVSDVRVRGNETLILTPAIEKQSHSLLLPSVELMGRRAYIYALRNDELNASDKTLCMKRGKSQSIDYTTTLHYEEWMRSANITIAQSSVGCTPTPTLLGENILQRILHEPYKPQYALSLITPAPASADAERQSRASLHNAESHSAHLNFKVEGRTILPTYRNNATALASIIEAVERVQSDKDLTITSITVDGWSSPEGPQAYNESVATARAEALADYIAQHSGIRREQITATGRGEDWARLREEVATLPHLLDRDKVLAIIDDASLSSDEKNERIKSLVPPTIYQRIYNEIYYKLRRADVRIEYVRGFNVEQARERMKSEPATLSLDDMYRVAMSYDEGSQQWHEAMAVAARTYPDDVTAAVNTAAQQLSAGEHAAALATLAKCDKEDARVMNAMGYAYALGGDVARASELWDKAATKGSEDARHNLEELKKSLE